jgi:dolichol-phosphate mannosyltransferase
MSGVYIVIPTYNEAENIKTIIARIIDLNGDFHIVVVDDNSPDGTAAIAQSMDQLYGNIHIYRRKGKLGIGSATKDGMKVALLSPDCKFIITMDADLSHNPGDIPRLLEEVEGVDLVQGSRYVKGGKTVGWSLYRKLISRIANFLYRYLFKIQQHEIAFASALVIRDYGLKVKEVPIEVVNRGRGKSKVKISDIAHSISFLLVTFVVRLSRNRNMQRFIKFCIVGATGIGVNQGLLWLLTDIFGIYYLFSALVSIEISIISNFALNDSWTFKDIKPLTGNVSQRFLKYNLLCIMGAALNYVILFLFTELLNFHYLISNLFGIAAAFTWNYLLSLKWAWSKQFNKREID